MVIKRLWKSFVLLSEAAHVSEFTASEAGRLRSRQIQGESSS